MGGLRNRQDPLCLRERPLKEVRQVTPAPVTLFQSHPTSESLNTDP